MSTNTKKKWTLSDGVDSGRAAEFANEINIPLSLSRILISRGITNRTEAKKFFVPQLDMLYDPFLMKDMEKAAARIVEVINNKEKILVFGDYDVDGTSGVSMFHIFLKELGVPNKVFIPDRFTDGYGLSNTGIDLAAKENIRLIVAIDCGITAFDKVAYANSLDIDFIICDHHRPPENIPEAFAVLDPLRTDCDYPFKHLCGTGVAFKLIQAVCMRLGLNDYLKLLDFAAIATAADMVPVVDENRILITYGFRQIVDSPRPSISTLIQKAGFKVENINTSNVVFCLGPRINAVGRLGDASRAVEFLTCDDPSKVGALAGVLELENTNRKKIDTEIYVQAQNNYEDYKNTFEPGKDEVAIILHNADWHPGVLGIIASRMVEKYYRPAIIMTTFNGMAKGSARSINHFNIYDALKQCASEFSGLVQFGGHYHAAGLEIEIDRIDEFRSCFNRVAKDIIEHSENGREILVPEVKIDAELEFQDINKRFVKILKHFEPFGPSNMMPIFVSHNMQVVGEPRVFNNSTCVFKVREVLSESSPGLHKSFIRGQNVFECVYYQAGLPGGEDNFAIRTGDHVDIVYSVEENHWNDKIKTQLRIRDLKIL